MGHVRHGTLPDTRPWRKVVAHLAGGDALAVVAAATTRAAAAGLVRSRTDPGVARVVYLLAHLASAARADDFPAALRDVGLEVPARAPTAVDLTAAFAAALDHWHHQRREPRTDLARTAALAATEALTALLARGTAVLFATGTELHAAARALATPNGFAMLAHEFFARFARRYLLYHLARELSQHVGGHGRFDSARAHTAFLDDLDVHCREAALTVRDYAGRWHPKAEFEDGISADRARRFAAHCVSKVRDQLERRGAPRG